MARPRKLGRRKPCGRLEYDKKDQRFPSALNRVRDFGVTMLQSTSPFAGHLAGVMFLRGQLEARHMGHYYSYLQMVPVHTRAISYGIRVSGSVKNNFHPKTGYHLLARVLGKDIDVLHELANDRLVCSVDMVKDVLRRVPLTAGGSAYINWCETHHPKLRSRTTGGQSKSQTEIAPKDTHRHEELRR